MARRLRFIPDGGALVEVTCRTIQGRYLLRPSSELTSLTIGVLARAQRLYKVDLHAFVFLSNHYHLLLTVRNACQLARFMNYLNSNLAREAGRLQGWREKFWGRRYQAIIVSEEEGAQIQRLRYLLRHGCKEGLVDSPEQWPGAQSVKALTRGEALRGVWIDRTREYQAQTRRTTRGRSEFASVEVLTIAPLPCWSHLSSDKRMKLARDMVRQIEAETTCRNSENGIRSMGIRRVLSRHPHERPRKLSNRPAPIIHAVSKAARKNFVDAYSFFVAAYREASKRFRGGDPKVIFPKGSFPPAPAYVASTSGPIR